MRKVAWIIAILIVILLISIRVFRKKEFSKTQYLMDTVCEIKVISRINPKRAIDEAFRVMRKIDSIASFEGTGEIARINQGENIELSREIIEIIEEGIEIGKLTDGAFDITIHPLMELWDFKEKKIPKKEKIKRALPLIGYDKILLTNRELKFDTTGMGINLSGIAKGYAIDLAVKELKKYGIKTGLVNAGGDIRVFGDKVWKIGIQHPRGKGYVGVLALKDKAVATSGDYEKYFIVNNKRYHHLLNPKTGFPGTKCISVTIIDDKASTADALATGIFILGPKRGIELLDSLRIPGLIITPRLKFIPSNTFSNYVMQRRR
jgi:thiamine biosynthesis lipoprotein